MEASLFLEFSLLTREKMERLVGDLERLNNAEAPPGFGFGITLHEEYDTYTVEVHAANNRNFWFQRVMFPRLQRTWGPYPVDCMLEEPMLDLAEEYHAHILARDVWHQPERVESVYSADQAGVFVPPDGGDHLIAMLNEAALDPNGAEEWGPILLEQVGTSQDAR